MNFVNNSKDFFTGVLLIGVAAIFAAGLTKLPIGTAFRMGPGYFPMLLVMLLFALGAALVINGLRMKGERIGSIPWRGLLLVTCPVIFFGATLKGLGFLPSLSLAVFATTLANNSWTLRASLMTTAVIVISSWAIFLWGLGLPISIFGPWVGGH